MKQSLALLFAACAALSTPAQDQVQLHRVAIRFNGTAEVVYSKNFATCAHMRFSNATCTQYGALTHVNNVFCTSGTNVRVTLPRSEFVASFVLGAHVFMVHGNNGNVRSGCLQVVCDGSYGTGCAGTGGRTPRLSVDDACPSPGDTLTIAVSDSVPTAPAAIVVGTGSVSQPLLGCTLLVGPILVAVTIGLQPDGTGSLPLTIPAGTSGAIAFLQAFVLDGGGPQGLSATNGSEVRVQ